MTQSETMLMLARETMLMLARALSVIRHEATGALANYLSPDQNIKSSLIRIECRARDVLESLKNAAPQDQPMECCTSLKAPAAAASDSLDRNAIIEECAMTIESQKLTEPSHAGANKWGAAGLMQTVCAAAVRALKGKA